MRSIKKLGVRTIKSLPNSQPLYFLYPMIFPNSKTRNNMYDKLKILGIDSLKFYSDTPKIAQRKYGYNGECTLSEEIIASLLAFPTYYNIGYKIT